MADVEGRERQFQYDVFISYRHKPLDNRICKKLHTLLETYKPTRRYRNSRIKRVFRDDAELPVAGILSDTIRDALLSTRYLVVVCSPDTPESAWVDREVRTFIEQGRSDKVFALLISGTPEESFPKSLLSIQGIENRTLKISGSNERQMIRALKKEMLKIIAAAAKIPYDHLRVSHNRRGIRRFILTSAAFTLFLAASGLYSLYQWAQASYFSLYTEREELLIRDVINGITFDLPERLKNIPEARPVVARILEDNLQYLDRMAKTDPNSIDNKKSIGGDYLNLAEAWAKLGDPEKASEYSEKAVTEYTELAGNKKNSTGEEDLIRCYSLSALFMEMVGSNDLSATYFNKAIELGEELCRKNPSAELKKGIADNYVNLGDLSAMLKKPKDALKYYDTGFSYYLDLVSSGSMAESELGTAYSNAALALQNVGQYDDALKYYQKEEGLIEKANSANEGTATDLALCYTNQGLIYLAKSDSAMANQEFSAAMAIFEGNKDLSPQVRLYESQALTSMGLAYQQLGQYDDAESSFVKCGKILDSTPADPGDLLVKELTARNYQNIALNNKYQGRNEDAIANYGSAIELYKWLLDDKQDYTVLSDLAGALNDQGVAYLGKSDYKAAGSAFVEALASYDIIDKTSKNPANTKNIAISSYNAGLSFYNQADFSNATSYMEKAVNIYENMQNPSDASVRKALADCYNVMGSVYAYQYDFKNAVDFHQKCVDIYKDLAASDPTYQRGYAISLYGVMTDKIFTGEFDESEQTLILSLNICDKVYNNGGEDFYSTYLSFYANYYLLFGNDTQKALGIAVEASAANPGDPFAKQIYGYCLAFAGRDAEAKEQLSAVIAANPANLTFMKFDLDQFKAKGLSCGSLEKVIGELGN